MKKYIFFVVLAVSLFGLVSETFALSYTGSSLVLPAFNLPNIPNGYTQGGVWFQDYYSTGIYQQGGSTSYNATTYPVYNVTSPSVNWYYGNFGMDNNWNMTSNGQYSYYSWASDYTHDVNWYRNNFITYFQHFRDASQYYSSGTITSVVYGHFPQFTAWSYPVRPLFVTYEKNGNMYLKTYTYAGSSSGTFTEVAGQTFDDTFDSEPWELLFTAWTFGSGNHQDEHLLLFQYSISNYNGSSILRVGYDSGSSWVTKTLPQAGRPYMQMYPDWLTVMKDSAFSNNVAYNQNTFLPAVLTVGASSLYINTYRPSFCAGAYSNGVTDWDYGCRWGDWYTKSTFTYSVPTYSETGAFLGNQDRTGQFFVNEKSQASGYNNPTLYYFSESYNLPSLSMSNIVDSQWSFWNQSIMQLFVPYFDPPVDGTGTTTTLINYHQYLSLVANPVPTCSFVDSPISCTSQWFWYYLKSSENTLRTGFNWLVSALVSALDWIKGAISWIVLTVTGGISNSFPSFSSITGYFIPDINFNGNSTTCIGSSSGSISSGSGASGSVASLPYFQKLANIFVVAVPLAPSNDSQICTLSGLKTIHYSNSVPNVVDLLLVILLILPIFFGFQKTKQQ